MPGDKADQLDLETADWIHDDVAIAPSKIPLLVDKDRAACETILYTETGKSLQSLCDSGAQVNLVDKEEVKLWKPASTTSSYAAIPLRYTGSASSRSTSCASSS